MKPKQAKGLKPARNGEDIGLADEKSKKFFKLDHAHLSIWLLCNGNNDENKISENFIKILKQSSELEKEIDEKVLTEDIKKMIKTLYKFGLLE